MLFSPRSIVLKFKYPGVCKMIKSFFGLISLIVPLVFCQTGFAKQTLTACDFQMNGSPWKLEITKDGLNNYLIEFIDQAHPTPIQEVMTMRSPDRVEDREIYRLVYDGADGTIVDILYDYERRDVKNLGGEGKLTTSVFKNGSNIHLDHCSIDDLFGFE
jgi:hypothetical protein